MVRSNSGAINVKRLDQSEELISIKFISAAASAFSQEGVLPGHDADRLRLELTARSEEVRGQISPSSNRQTAEVRHQTLMEWLEGENSSFLQLLISRFGVLGVSRNLWRFSAVRMTEDLCFQLADIAKDLVEKTKMHFNRRITYYYASQPERNLYGSEFFSECSQLLLRELEQLEAAKSEIGVFCDSKFDETNEVSNRISEAFAIGLGFTLRHDDLCIWNRERQFCNSLAVCCNSFIAIIENLILQLRNNGFSEKMDQVSFHLESIQSLVSAFPTWGSETLLLSRLEKRRMHFLSQLHEIASGLEAVQHEIFESVFRINSFGAAAEDVGRVVTLEEKRAVEIQLNLEGKDPGKANKAVAKLFAYCEEKNVRPTDLIDAELAKIDQHLSRKSIEAFERTLDGIGSHQFEIRQTRALSKQDELLKKFHVRLKSLGVFTSTLWFLLALITVSSTGILSACGVKGNPVSKEPDLRPTVELRKGKQQVQEIEGADSKKTKTTTQNKITEPQGRQAEKIESNPRK